MAKVSQWGILLMLALCTRPYAGHSPPSLTPTLFGDCPSLKPNLDDEASRSVMSATASYAASQEDACSRHIGSSLAESVFDIEGAGGSAPRLRCTALYGCSPGTTTSLRRLIHEKHGFKHCQVIVATAVYRGYDTLPPAPPTRFPNITCFVAFLDAETEALHVKYLAGGRINGWIPLNIPTTGFVENACLKARLWKHLLPQLFPAVRWSIWTDAKIKVKEVSSCDIAMNTLP